MAQACADRMAQKIMGELLWKFLCDKTFRLTRLCNKKNIDSRVLLVQNKMSLLNFEPKKSSYILNKGTFGQKHVPFLLCWSTFENFLIFAVLKLLYWSPPLAEVEQLNVQLVFRTIRRLCVENRLLQQYLFFVI